MGVQVILPRQKQRAPAPRPERKEDFLDKVLKGLKVAELTTGAAVNIESLMNEGERRAQQQKLTELEIAKREREQARGSALARGFLPEEELTKMQLSGKFDIKEAERGAKGAIGVGLEDVTTEAGERLGDRPRRFVTIDPRKTIEEKRLALEEKKVAAVKKVEKAKEVKLAAETEKLNKEIEALSINKIGGLKRKDIKDSQWVAAKTAVRQDASERIIEDLAKKGFDFGGFETALVQSGTDAEGKPLIRFVAKNIQSEDQRAYATAVWNWITAQLRKESGAAISASEFQTEYQTFFPSVGATPGSINVKASERARKMGGNITEAGEELFEHVKREGEKYAKNVYKLPLPSEVQPVRPGARPQQSLMGLLDARAAEGTAVGENLFTPIRGR